MKDLGPALDSLLAPMLERGPLSPVTGSGLVIGILDHGAQHIYAYGAAQEDSIFEIGSVTKTFTGLALAQMIVQKKVALDEPVRELLPPGIVAQPVSTEITLLDLVTQRSGLPRLPENLARNPAVNPANPYANYGADQLYAYLRKRGLKRPAGAKFEYSNLGFGLLGHALALRAGTSYEEMIRREILAPLGLEDTAVALFAAQRARLLPGHDAENKTVPAWDFQDALAGCGALRSSAGDLLKYLQANLHPERLTTGETEPNSSLATMPAAFALDHAERGDAQGPYKIAFAWMYVPQSQGYWHNGGTGGYTSEVLFNRKKDLAIVVLHNRQDIDPKRAKPQFSSQILQNVILLVNGRDPMPLQ